MNEDNSAVLKDLREKFRLVGDPLQILDDHEGAMAIDASNRLAYLLAAHSWRVQILEHLDEIEARLEKLEES